MKTELMVDCQISGGMAEALIDAYFDKVEPAPKFWISKSRLGRILSKEIDWPHVYTTDQSEHFECVPLFISAPTPAPAPQLQGYETRKNLVETDHAEDQTDHQRHSGFRSSPASVAAYGSSGLSPDGINQHSTELDPPPCAQMMGAAVEEYLLIHAAEGDAERLGRRSAIRGLMVRLGKYHELCAALNVASPMSPTAYNGCTCSCHRGSGKMHIVACCSPSPETKAEDLSPEETAIATCEACGKHIQEGEPYLWGPETDFCGECAPTYQALIDEPEGFVNADGEPLTPEQCRAWFDEHIAAGGKATDSMATVDRTPVTLPQEHVTGPQRIETAPVEGFFLAETRDGDWIKAEHYDNPFGDKNTVISRRTGKWWSPARWMPLPEKQSDTEWEDNK
ncbi:hypothetical protein JNB91_23925 [Rhizobium wenxiniae]|uniref:hypothetical protein n=1 Tax=Rhizobium wenxiniae TaxID=1737357 RepID=UPI001C6F0C54|nr:hypothetical protein [Rhizobium wenxiniae]MBW9090865.1 hypothetical protein [Rhizobium wenxiniae]